MIFPTSREIAIQNGHKYYNTGTPCQNGHTSDRYTLSSVCTQCHRDRSKRNADKIRKIALNHGLGLVHLTIGIHPDDLATAEAFLKALLLDRGIY
jgi:hypothetical protein